MRCTERVVRVSIKDFSTQSIDGFEHTVYLLAVQVQNNLNIALSAPGNKFYIEAKEDDIHRCVNNFEHYDDFLFKGRKPDIEEQQLDIKRRDEERARIDDGKECGKINC